MKALAFMLGLAVVCSMPAQAQDVLGPVNPVDYMPAITMGAAINAQSEAIQRQRQKQGLGNHKISNREICHRIPRYRAKYGARNPNIIKLTRLCQRAGYRIR
jgi:hypothetical protein